MHPKDVFIRRLLWEARQQIPNKSPYGIALSLEETLPSSVLPLHQSAPMIPNLPMGGNEPKAPLRGCPEMGSPAAAPIPFQTVLFYQSAVLLGGLGAARWLCFPVMEFRDSR